MKLKVCLVLSCIVLFISANAQFRLGIQASGLKLPKSTGNYGMSFGPGIDVGYSPDESKLEYYFTGSYFLPVSTVGTGLVYDNTSSSATATLTQKTSILALGLGSRYFFIDRESDFNVFAAAHVSYLMANTTATYSNVPAGYSPAYNDDAGGKSNQFMIGFGLGMEYKIGNGAIFADGHFRFPASTYNSRSGYASDVQIPAHLGFAIGYRFSLGGGSYY